MARMRAVLWASTLGLTAAVGLAAGGWPTSGVMRGGITGPPPLGATGRAPLGATGSVVRPLVPTGNRGGANAGFHGGGIRGGGSQGFYHGHGRGYGGPNRRYGVVAPFFYGLPYDASGYYGPNDSDYYPGPYDGPGPTAQDPASQHEAIQENMLGEEIQRLNNKIEELQQQQSQAMQPPPSADQPSESNAAPPAPPPPPVTVILRDGRKFQSTNYAIMNGTFWDFSKIPARQVPMANVDLPASVQATEAAGAEFPE